MCAEIPDYEAIKKLMNSQVMSQLQVPNPLYRSDRSDQIIEKFRSSRPHSLEDDLRDEYIHPAPFCFIEVDAFNLDPLGGRSEVTHIIVRKEIKYHDHLFTATETADVRYLRRDLWSQRIDLSRREVDRQLLEMLMKVETVRKKILKSAGHSAGQQTQTEQEHALDALKYSLNPHMWVE